MKCEHITEFGVRTGVSTRAFLKAGKTLRSYDLVQDATVQGLFYAARRIQDAKYYPADTLNLEIDRTDLLFIDTDHTYEQLSAELWLHADKVNKYIIFHDTTYHCADLVPAIFEFLDYHKGDWLIEKHFRNNNGLTIIKRKEVA
jgi:glycogen synthase